MKYILVTGGVISGLGKGVSSSSVGYILQKYGFEVTMIKIDPYLNIDAGTMSPFEHGEVYVLNDGGEVDLDLGNYERFLDIHLTKDHNITTGKVYKQVLERERDGKFLGQTVQMVPHITNAIIEWIERVSQIPVSENNRTPDICIIELGGTVGDIESMVFLEALRQLRYEKEKSKDFCHIHVSLVPVVKEQKSKPTQHSYKELRGAGLTPNFIFCRCEEPISDVVRRKIGMFCMVPEERVISVNDVENIYDVPMLLHSQGIHDHLLYKLGLQLPIPKQDTEFILFLLSEEAKQVEVGVVCKYLAKGLSDTYLSIRKALIHAAYYLDISLKINWINAEKLEDKDISEWKKLDEVSCVLVPGGFGKRGSGGKLDAINKARVTNTPFLGICLGFQLAVIEYCRNALGLTDVHSQELEGRVDESSIIALLPRNASRSEVGLASPIIPNEENKMGGTMRLGLQTVYLDKGSKVYKMYGTDEIRERHRHRYEVNKRCKYYNKLLEDGNFMFSGGSKEGLDEVLELKHHPFFVASQYHPEYLSRLKEPAPLFVSFLEEARNKLKD